MKPEETIPAKSTQALFGSNYHLFLDTVIMPDESIRMTLRSATKTLSRLVVNSRDEATRNALIKMGWIPPSLSPAAVAPRTASQPPGAAVAGDV